jgi:predicted transcriptional regulator
MQAQAGSPERKRKLELVAIILSAYLRARPLGSVALPELIRAVYDAIDEADETAHLAEDDGPQPSRSIFDDHLVCLEDGLRMKMLKRHLLTVHNMSPDEYRQKWQLPADYPMVAPNYTKVRSSLAKQSGLGKKPSHKVGRSFRRRRP